MGCKWAPRPKSLSEKGYRKYMKRTKTITIRGKEYKLQSVSPRWNNELYDRCNMSGLGRGIRNSTEFADELIKNCVISPPEVGQKGLDYFEENDDVGAARELSSAVESFLAG